MCQENQSEQREGQREEKKVKQKEREDCLGLHPYTGEHEV